MGAFQANPPTYPDAAIQAVLNDFSDPQFLLSSQWDVNGTAALVEDGAKTGAQLTETAGTSIGQDITPSGSLQAISFNLSHISAGPGDTLELLFNSQVLGTVALAGAVTAGGRVVPPRRLIS